MTPHPQHFIINFDELMETKMLLNDMFGGEVHLDRLLDIVNTVNSRPLVIAASERDKVLGELETRYVDLCNEGGIQGYSKLLERNILSNLLPLLRQYEELRKGGE